MVVWKKMTAISSWEMLPAPGYYDHNRMCDATMFGIACAMLTKVVINVYITKNLRTRSSIPQLFQFPIRIIGELGGKEGMNCQMNQPIPNNRYANDFF